MKKAPVQLGKKLKLNYYLLAFLVPLISMFIAMIIRGTEPFGNSYSMLYSDMYHQYYPFFYAFRDTLRSGGSLLYNWDVGMGMDYLGLISYYLASPLNLLSVLVPEGLVLEYFSLLMPIKLSLASLFFALFLGKVFGKKDPAIVMFGAFYGFCAWALGYQWNIMWLDTFALLPLVMLGTVSLMREGKFILYTVSLCLSVLTNYYIGFFTCIFVFLVFICYQICRWQGFVKFLADLCRIAVFSILAIGMTAILELPTLAALQTTQSSVNKFPQTLDFNIVDENTWAGLFDAMKQVAGNMSGGLEPTFKEGLPNVYCGVFSVIFAVLFLSAKEIKLRDKICCLFLLLFFSLSFIIRQLDYIWHGFHFPNMIPHRFSFLYSFVMLYMAYRAYLLRRQFKLWQIILAGVAALGVMLCAEDLTDPAYWGYNGAMLLLYIGVFVYGCLPKKAPQEKDKELRTKHLKELINRRQTASYLLCGVMLMEMILNLVNFNVAFPSTGVSNYPKGLEDTASIVEIMKELEDDNPFYRTEVNRSQTLNDGALNGFYGITTFTSSANVKVTEFMKALGYGAKNTYNRYRYEESSPIAELFLGLKYLIDREDQAVNSSYYDEVFSVGKVTLLKNNAYLPLGFLANAQLLNVDFSTATNDLIFQNELLRAAAGINTDPWTLIVGNPLTIYGSDNVNMKTTTQTGYSTYSATGTGTVTYSYSVEQDGYMCVELDLSKKNKFNIYVNGQCIETGSESTSGRSYSLPLTVSVGDVTAGDLVEVKFKCKQGESGTIRVNAGVMDAEIFREAHSILNASTLQLTTFKDTYLEGSINCNRSGVLYTSIPQNGNWIATVDGKPAQSVLIGDAMLGLLLPEGQHTVTFRYHNAAFSLGWKVTLGCAIVFGLLIWRAYPTPTRKKGKYQK